MIISLCFLALSAIVIISVLMYGVINGYYLPRIAEIIEFIAMVVMVISALVSIVLIDIHDTKEKNNACADLVEKGNFKTTEECIYYLDKY